MLIFYVIYATIILHLNKGSDPNMQENTDKRLQSLVESSELPVVIDPDMYARRVRRFGPLVEVMVRFAIDAGQKPLGNHKMDRIVIKFSALPEKVKDPPRYSTSCMVRRITTITEREESMLNVAIYTLSFR